MTALDIANAFIDRYSKDLHLTNLKLNKLVYYAQVESLRETGRPLFTDQVQAWGYGPVIPSVYRAYKAYGNRRIMQISDDYRIDSYAEKVMSIVAQKYGYLTAFDLVDYSHRKGSAWEKHMMVSVIKQLRSKPLPDHGISVSILILRVH